jgi:flagellar basal-body rod modification protein FlgD
MAINPIDQSLIDSLGLGNKQASTGTGNNLGQSDFLKLMTTQLNNQDPMKPMDSGEFFNQITQFSSVAGIQDLQNTFSKVADAMLSGQALQASSLVGRNVMLESSTAYLQDNSSVEGAVDLSMPVDNARVDVYTQSGELVKSIELGQQAKGLVEFSWDGTDDKGNNMPPGTYDMKAEVRYGRDTYSQGTLLKERVESVTLGNGLQDIKLNMANSGDILFSQVKKIL